MVVSYFGTYIIQNSHNGGLELPLRGMEKSNVDLGLVQKTRIIDDIYVRKSAGFYVVALYVLSRHRGGLVLFYKDLPCFAVKSHR